MTRIPVSESAVLSLGLGRSMDSPSKEPGSAIASDSDLLLSSSRQQIILGAGPGH